MSKTVVHWTCVHDDGDIEEGAFRAERMVAVGRKRGKDWYIVHLDYDERLHITEPPYETIVALLTGDDPAG